MNLYEFITPSDPITFKADNDKVAYLCALLLGNGGAGCKNIDTGESVPTMLMFCPEPAKEIEKYIGSTAADFISDNKQNMIECFKSFSYGSVEDRITYDDACEAITDPVKLQEFKSKHEDKNRTSLSTWVKSAWNMAEDLS